VALVPVAAMVILLLGEQPRLFHLAGRALVLAGVMIAARIRDGGPLLAPLSRRQSRAGI
jgi:drug/metabolite transporter (DMT)-like permease